MTIINPPCAMIDGGGWGVGGGVKLLFATTTYKYTWQTFQRQREQTKKVRFQEQENVNCLSVLQPTQPVISFSSSWATVKEPRTKILILILFLLPSSFFFTGRHAWSTSPVSHQGAAQVKCCCFCLHDVKVTLNMK